MKTQIFCTLQIDGLHQWKDCNIEEVEYLKYIHRHIFHIKCIKSVTHNDRDIEFITLKNKIVAFIQAYYPKYLTYQIIDFGNNSCESIALNLLNVFQLDIVEVSEDNENGAIVTKENI